MLLLVIIFGSVTVYIGLIKFNKLAKTKRVQDQIVELSVFQFVLFCHCIICHTQQNCFTSNYENTSMCIKILF